MLRFSRAVPETASPARRRVAVGALTLLTAPPVLGASVEASAESLGPRAGSPATTVRIDPEGLSPDRASLDAGRTLRFSNESTAMARVEFRIERGTGLPCARPGEPPVSARKFVLARGAALHCLPPAGTVEYRVQRVVGSRNRITEGEIEVR